MKFESARVNKQTIVFIFLWYSWMWRIMHKGFRNTKCLLDGRGQQEHIFLAPLLYYRKVVIEILKVIKSQVGLDVQAGNVISPSIGVRLARYELTIWDVIFILVDKLFVVCGGGVIEFGFVFGVDATFGVYSKFHPHKHSSFVILTHA